MSLGRRRQRPGVRGGFTLIEMLIVIAIIGILAAMLMPAISKANELARQVYCTNNLKAMGSTALSYANEWSGWYVPVHTGTAAAGIYWYGNAEYKRMLQVGTTAFPPSMFCPSAEAAFSVNSMGLSYAIGLSYGMNFQDLMATWAATTFHGYRVTAIKKPGHKFAFADGNDGILGYTAANPETYYWVYGESYSATRGKCATAYRHGQRLSANMVFFDGHAENRNWLDVFGAKNYNSLWRALN